MKFPAVIILFLSLCGSGLAGEFLDKQKKYSRFRGAYKLHAQPLKKLFQDKGLPYPCKNILIRVFKGDSLLELWAAKSARDTLQLLKSYKICDLSGGYGPKRMQGDLQIPEGFYHISAFNPVSSFHLSMKVNYPNASDRILGVKGRLGGDIFIHGACITIGCVPITDKQIKELYVIAVLARDRGNYRIPVHIFPTRLTEESLPILVSLTKADSTLTAFWKNLEEGYSIFERTHKIPRFKINKAGKYTFTSR